MKKLMIASAIICAATFAHAAKYNWADSNDDLYYSGQDENPVAAGITVYLFDTASKTQQDVLDMFNGSGLSGYIANASSATTASGSITAKEFTDSKVAGVDSNWQGFYALIAGDEIFISAEQTFTVQASITQPVAFNDMYDFSTAAAIESDKFSSAGWYTQSVPEPTSGLLLLLGVAGLALRRRRA